MENNVFNVLSAAEVLKRRNFMPSCNLIALSGAGKSTVVNNLIDPTFGTILRNIIGDKNQTTLISTEYVLDSRIDKNDCAIKIILNPLSEKKLLITLSKVFFKIFEYGDFEIESAIEQFDEKIINAIFEPDTMEYHLGYLRKDMDVDLIKKVASDFLTNINKYANNDFKAYCSKERLERKAPKQRLLDFQREIFFEIIDKILSEEFAFLSLYDWFNNLNKLIINKLKNILNNVNFNEGKEEITFSCTPEDREVIRSVFDPKEPYSLVIKEIRIALRPNEYISSKSPYPFRLRIRDTMGLSQVGIDDESMKEAADIGFGFESDCMLILFNLEERHDNLRRSWELIHERFKRKPFKTVGVLFTKADKIIESKIDKLKNSTILSQKDYDNNINSIIEEIEQEVSHIVSNHENYFYDWLSMRYIEENMSMVQISLKNQQCYRNKFRLDGLCDFVYELTNETQKRLLPHGVKPLYLSVNDTGLPIINFEINKDKINDVLDSIKKTLTQDIQTVNGYRLTEKTPWIHGHTVVVYMERKLPNGIGHTSNSSYYGNININMKGLLLKILRTHFGNIDVFCSKNAISSNFKNIKEGDLARLFEYFGMSDEEVQKEINNINPGVYKIKSRYDHNIFAIIIHKKIMELFRNEYVYLRLLDSVAFQLSYHNNKINERIIKKYNIRYSYDSSIRAVQEEFFNIFSSDDFKKYVVHEFEDNMSKIISKNIIPI